MTDDNEVQIRKQASVHFLQLVVSGQIEDAYQQYTNTQGKHHNVFTSAGFSSLKKAMIENHTQFPNKQITVKHVLGDGDIVAVHSRLLMNPLGKELVTVHLFRFSGDKIVEFWDCGQPVPEDSPNIDGPF